MNRCRMTTFTPFKLTGRSKLMKRSMSWERKKRLTRKKSWDTQIDNFFTLRNCKVWRTNCTTSNESKHRRKSVFNSEKKSWRKGSFDFFLIFHFFQISVSYFREIDLLTRELHIMFLQQAPTPTPSKRKGHFKKLLLKRDPSQTSSLISAPLGTLMSHYSLSFMFNFTPF